MSLLNGRDFVFWANRCGGPYAVGTEQSAPANSTPVLSDGASDGPSNLAIGGSFTVNLFPTHEFEPAAAGVALPSSGSAPDEELHPPSRSDWSDISPGCLGRAGRNAIATIAPTMVTAPTTRQPPARL